jgi:multimeric flavodoxin WrbA
MNAIGFNASPRKGGNTAWSVEQILEGAAEAGFATQLFQTSELNIGPCRGCLGCQGRDGCVANDDMQLIYAALREADALVLGSPIYMAQMSSQAKAFTDRLFAQVTPRFSPSFKEENAGKRLTLLFSQGNPDQSRFQAYYDYTRAMFAMLEFDVVDLLVVTGTRSEQARDNPVLRDTLRAAGQRLAIRPLEGDASGVADPVGPDQA